jgi:hypothetical protein
MIIQTFYAGLNFSLRNLLDSAAGGMISHKYRGLCVAFSISKSVKPNEELKVG